MAVAEQQSPTSSSSMDSHGKALWWFIASGKPCGNEDGAQYVLRHFCLIICYSKTKRLSKNIHFYKYSTLGQPKNTMHSAHACIAQSW